MKKIKQISLLAIILPLFSANALANSTKKPPSLFNCSTLTQENETRKNSCEKKQKDCKPKTYESLMKEYNSLPHPFREKIEKMKIDRVIIRNKITTLNQHLDQQDLRAFEDMAVLDDSGMSLRNIDVLKQTKLDLQQIKHSYGLFKSEYQANYDGLIDIYEQDKTTPFNHADLKFVLKNEWCKWDSVLQSEQLDPKLKLTSNAIRRDAATSFRFIVKGWQGVVPNFNALAETAERVLLFEQAENQEIWGFIANLTKTATGFAGGTISLKLVEEKKYSEAILSLLGALAAYGLISWGENTLLPKHQTLDAVIRNVAFNDDLRAILKLTQTLDKNVRDIDSAISNSLEEKIAEDKKQKSQTATYVSDAWVPDNKIKSKFNEIITNFTAINTMMISLQQKSQYLLDNYSNLMTEESKKSLESLIKKFTEVDKNWNKTKDDYATVIEILSHF